MTTPDERGYYGMSMINPPIWEEREIAGYLFLGGLAGASSLQAAVASASGSRTLARRSKLCATAAIALSLAALVKDLGRPERFLNMLRVVKPTSPMNIGTWILTLYAPMSFAASLSEITGRGQRLGRAAGFSAAGLGTVVTTYTGALIADTAVPVWHEAHRELPWLFAGSAAMAAGGFGMLAAPRSENVIARRLALAGAATELAVDAMIKQRVGPARPALEDGKAGSRLRLSQKLTVGGALAALSAGRRSRPAAVGAGIALLVASGLTRFGMFAAGMESARDPRYTIEVQRGRERS